MGVKLHRMYDENEMTVEEKVQLSDDNVERVLKELIRRGEEGFTQEKAWETLKENADVVDIHKEI